MLDLFDAEVESIVKEESFYWVDGLKYYSGAPLLAAGFCGPDDRCTYEYLTGPEGLEVFCATLQQIVHQKSIFAFDFETSPRKSAPVDPLTGAFAMEHLSWSTQKKENGSEPHTSIVFLLSLSVKKNKALVVDVREMRQHPRFIDLLGKALTLGKPIASNFAFDWRFAKMLTGVEPVVYFDPMVGTQLLYAGLPNPHVPWTDPEMERPKISRKSGAFPSGISLGSMIKENMGLKMDKGMQAEFLDIHPDSPMTNGLIAYAAGDTAILLELTYILRKRLEDKGLWKVWQEFEAPFLPILADMQLQGMVVDVPHIIELWEIAKRECTALAEQWDSRNPTLNLTSNPDILAWLQKKYPVSGIVKVDKPALEELNEIVDDEDVKILLAYRTVSKVESTYLAPWVLKERNPITGRIHGDFSQAATDTGRCAMSKPNLMNVPGRGFWACVRDCFVSDPGNVLIDVDYSQYEVRALADMSGETGMMEFFHRLGNVEEQIDKYLLGKPDLKEALKHNKLSPKADRIPIVDETYLALEAEASKNDFHTLNSVALFGKLVTEEPDAGERAKYRVKAKSLSFGIPYGIGAGKIARSFKIDKEKGQDLIDTFFKTWVKVKAFLDKCKREARYRKEIVSPTGRKRFFYVPESFRYAKTDKFRDPYEAHWAACEREAQNWPLQSINGDTLKRACMLIAPKLKQYGARLVLLVHDEIVAECPKEHAEVVMELMQKCMEQAAHECGIVTCPISTSGIYFERWVH